MYFPESSKLTGLATELFQVMDRDKSGSIDSGEFLHAVWQMQQTKHGAKTRLWNGHPSELFASIDKNSNERIDLDEWMTYLKAMWEVLGEASLSSMLATHIKLLVNFECPPVPASPKVAHTHHKAKPKPTPQKEKKERKQKEEDADQETAMFRAAELGQAEIIRELLSEDADPNVQTDDFGETPLQIAAKGGKYEAVKALIEGGADLNTVTVVGASALMISASHGYKKIVSTLLEHKADTTCMNATGDNVLSLAEEANHAEIVELLKKHGARPSTKRALTHEWSLEICEDAVLPTDGDLRHLLA